MLPYQMVSDCSWTIPVLREEVGDCITASYAIQQRIVYLYGELLQRLGSASVSVCIAAGIPVCICCLQRQCVFVWLNGWLTVGLAREQLLMQ